MQAKSFQGSAALAINFAFVISSTANAQISGRPWAMHTIDDSARGADGVRLADVNGDCLPDIATGWEEAGRVRVCIHPGYAHVDQRWPSVTVGSVGSPEDAVLVDLDGDGAVDVVSCSEGQTRAVHVHWAPREPHAYLDASCWTTAAIEASAERRMWMYCLPMDVDGRHGVDLVVGAKGQDARIGWFQSPPKVREMAAWRWHPLCDAGWIMSLVAADVDRDGDDDIVASDRKGPKRGCFWLENPGVKMADNTPWRRRLFGAEKSELQWMFLATVDLDADGYLDVLAAVVQQQIIFHRGDAGATRFQPRHAIAFPAGVGTGKGVAAADIDIDGRMDLVCTCENSAGKIGVFWMSRDGTSTHDAWQAHDIAGTRGTKFDLVQLVDLDGDQDIDVLTCEERENLGVIWFENPTRP